MSEYVSFGQCHLHCINGLRLGPNVLAKVSSRDRAFELFNDQFCTTYSEARLPSMKYFPEGILEIPEDHTTGTHLYAYINAYKDYGVEVMVIKPESKQSTVVPLVSSCVRLGDICSHLCSHDWGGSWSLTWIEAPQYHPMTKEYHDNTM
jgi:hypothetical protein